MPSAKKPPAEPTRKEQIDAAYFFADKMFARISGNGIGIRLPVATATDLQFSRENVTSFSPGGMSSTREGIQIDRANAADYQNDSELFQAPVGFVNKGRR